MKKKMIAVLLACALTAGMTAGPAGLVMVRAEGEQVKTTENGLTYQEIGDGINITDYDGTSTEVVIPESIDGKKVTGIGDCAFNGCRGLTRVNIPEGIMSIGNWAFSDCSGLTSVNIPEGITSIGNWAFSDCSGLTSVNIPEGITNIGNCAFSGCNSLRDIQVEETNADYKSEDGILYNKEKTSLLVCPGGKTGSIAIPDGVASIEGRAFNGCSGLTSVDIPEGITSIEYSVFEGCSGLTSVNIPAGVTSIRNSAFSGCSGLTSVDIPEGVTSIGNRAFRGCSGLTGVNIPSSVTYIGDGVFSACSSLRDIQAEETNTAYKSENGILYNKEKTSILICPGGKIGSMAIPEGVTDIGDSAFSGCSGLTSVNIPSSVTSIGEKAFFV